MKKQSLRFLLALALCITVMLSACASGSTDTAYSRRALKGEIEQYLNSGYVLQTFWINNDNCLLAFSNLDIEKNNTERHYRVYKYSIPDDKTFLIFDDELNECFGSDNSFCRVTDDGILLVVGNTIMRFNDSYEYLEEKKVSIDDGTFVSVSNDGKKAAILSGGKLYCADVDSIDDRIKAFDRYYNYLGNVCFTADGNAILQSSPEGKTTVIDVFDIKTQTLSHLNCLDSLEDDDHIGAGLLYPYDEKHVMLRINGAEFTDFHDTYVLINHVDDTCEVIHRTPNISEFPFSDASGTFTIEKGESQRLVTNPFNEDKITVELEEAPSKYGCSVWINPNDYSFIFLDRTSENEHHISIYARNSD